MSFLKIWTSQKQTLIVENSINQGLRYHLKNFKLQVTEGRTHCEADGVPVGAKRLGRQRPNGCKWIHVGSMGGPYSYEDWGNALNSGSICPLECFGLFQLFYVIPGTILYMFLGTVKEVSIGPSSLMALLTLQTCRGLPIEFVVLLTFLAGCVVMLMGLLRLGKDCFVNNAQESYTFWSSV